MLRSSIVVAVVVLLAGCGIGSTPAGPTQRDHQVVELDKAELTHVRLTMSAGELEVKGGANKLLEGDFTYNVAAWKPSVVRTANGNESNLEISQGSETVIGKTENRWQLALNDAMPLDVNAHLGAGQANMKLGSLNLRNVELSIGAGEVMMDLRGTPTKSYKVSLHGGVGTATVHVPTNVAISATASGGIGSVNVSGLEQRDGRWINPRATSSPVTIELDIQGGVGEIRIVAEVEYARSEAAITR